MRAGSILLAACLITGLPHSAASKALLGEPVVDRPTDGTSHQFCPTEIFPFDGTFTADGPDVTFVISAANHTPTGWREERLDNFAVLPLSTYLTYTHLPDSTLWGEFQNCIYSFETYFHFSDVPSQDFVYFEAFDSGIPAGWDLSDGAYYDPVESAINDFNLPITKNGGSLGLGLQTNPDSTVSTEITITGFVAGQDYYVTAWEHVDLPNGQDLKFQIYGTEFFLDQSTVEVDPEPSRGVCWGDWDDDGDDDLYVTNGSPFPNALYRNDGGTFEPIVGTPLGLGDDSRGAAWGDADNDGDLDLYVANDGTSNRLFENRGGGIFVDVTAAPVNHTGEGTSVSWVDHDLDGDLDLFCGDLSQNQLYRNDGGWQFVDVANAAVRSARTRAAPWCDADGDGDQDLYLVREDGRPNELLRNDGGGSFVTLASTGLEHAGNTTSAAWADWDADGDADLHLVVDQAPDQLYRNDGGLSFTALTVGLEDPNSGQESTWLDYDHDGDLDLYLARSLIQPNALWRNDGGTFSQHVTGIVEGSESSAGTAGGDADCDGDLDLYVANAEWDHFFRNDIGHRSHWITLQLEGVTSNRDAVGARVRISAGGQDQYRDVFGGTGRESQDSHALEFGLGTTDEVDSVRVAWPSGLVELYGPFAADQKVSIVEGGTVTTAPIEATPVLQLSAARPNPFREDTAFSFQLERAGATQLRVFDIAGRHLRTLVDAPRQPGRYSVRWDGRDSRGQSVGAGIYFVELRTGEDRLTRKVVRLGR